MRETVLDLKSKNISSVLISVFLLISTGFLMFGQHYSQKIVDSYSSLSLRFTMPIQPDNVEDEILPDGLVETIYWRQDNNVLVQNKLFKRGSRAQVIFYLGNLGSFAGLNYYGALPPVTNHCSISTALAEDLFGNSSPNNKFIYLEDEKFVIASTFDSKNMIIYANDLLTIKTKGYTCIDLKIKNGKDEKVVLQEFILNNDIKTPSQVVNGYFVVFLVKNLLFVFPLVLALFMSIKIFFCGDTQNKFLFKKWFLFILIFIIVAWISGRCNGYSIPSHFMPTRWSDLSFWNELIDQYTTGLRSGILSVPTINEQNLIQYILNAIFFSSLGFIILSAILFFSPINSAEHLGIRLCISIISPFIWLSCFNNIQIYTGIISMNLFPPLVFILQFLANKQSLLCQIFNKFISCIRQTLRSVVTQKKH